MTYPQQGQCVEALPTRQLRAECRREAELLEREIRDAIGWLARQLSPRVEPKELLKDVQRFRDASLTTLLAALIACMRHPQLTMSLVTRFAMRCWAAIASYRPSVDESLDELYAEETRAEAEANIDQAMVVAAGDRLCVTKAERSAESTLREVASSFRLYLVIRELRDRARRSPHRLAFRQ